MRNPQKPRNTKPLGQSTAKHRSTAEQPDAVSQNTRRQGVSSLQEEKQSLILPSAEQQNVVDHQEPPDPGPDWLGRLSTRQGLAFLIGGSALSIIVAVAAAMHFFVFQTRSPDIQQMLPPPASLSELAKEFPELATILNDARLDSIFKDFLMTSQKGGNEAAYELAKKRGLLNDQDELILTLELDTTETGPLKAELESLGIKATTVSNNLMDIAVPLDIIQKSMESDEPGGIFNGIVGLEHVLRIRMPIIFQGNESIRIPIPSMELKGLAWPLRVGKKDIESLPTINAIRWHEYHFTGKGMKIGVLDAGFDQYKNLLGTDLPKSVTVRSFVYGKAIDALDETHGTSCAEIIHDIAPDADLVFASFRTDAEAYQAMNWLVSQGVQIISNSTGGEVGPLDGTSDFSRHVDRIVENGVLWVNSAGNEAISHYRGTFTDEDGNGYHEFAPGDELIEFTIPAGKDYVVLNWDDWQNGYQNFDLFIYDEDENLIASSENIQNGPGTDSFEFVIYDFPGTGPYYAAFYAANATRRVVFDFFVHYGKLGYQAPEYSISSPGDARRSLTVGAVNWFYDVLKEYSSRGPTPDGRLKPELSAPTDVTSVVLWGLFNGTSAACPHVSGAASLVWQANPNFTNQQVTGYLESQAVDLGENGSDNNFGYGRLWLGDPPGASPLPTPTKASAFLPPSNTTTPTRRLTSTPASSDNETEANNSLVMFICVAAPGLMGLAGIGVLGSIWYRNRMQSSENRLQESPIYPPVINPVASPKPWTGLKIGTTKRCPRCGSPHRPQVHYCTTCGYSLKHKSQPARAIVYCSYCGQSLRSTSKFCNRCGKPRK